MPPRLHRITIYPIKSLDGVSVDQVDVLPSGSLAGDRRFALLDHEGRFVNGKRTAAVHQIRASYDLPNMHVHLHDAVQNATAEFSLVDSHVELGNWFSKALGINCLFAENTLAGFPDDTDAPGPTLVSTATLREVARWFPGLSLDETRRRFRANLEIDAAEPFWEDRLVGAAGSEVNFEIGQVRLLGINPCQRCVVPTRAAETGELTAEFQKTFAVNRERSLPPWAPPDRFNHFYRLAINTRLAPQNAARILRIGDPVTH